MLGVEEIKNLETITVPRHEWEQLVRDSQTLCCVESLARREDKYVECDAILALCGYIKKVAESE